MNTRIVSRVQTIRRQSHHVSVVPSSGGWPVIGSCHNEFWSHRSCCWSNRSTFLSVKKVWKSICMFLLMVLVLAVGRTGKWWWFLMFFAQLSFLQLPGNSHLKRCCICKSWSPPNHYKSILHSVAWQETQVRWLMLEQYANLKISVSRVMYWV